jgi:hypothetical protein
MKNHFDQNGKTAVELMLVMVLLLLFSMAALTLVASGSETYVETVKKGDVASELRIAQSYLHTKMRQNNVVGAIRIGTFKGIDSDCLIIKDNDYGSDFITVIYVQEGKLYEALIPDDGIPTRDISFEICKLDGFLMEEEIGKGVKLRTWLMGDDGEKSLESYIAIALDH